MPTPGRRPRFSRVERGAKRRSDAERAVLVEESMGSPVPARVARALGEPRVPSSLGGRKGKGRGAQGVGTSHRKERNCEQGKGFGAKTITNWTARKAAE